MKVFRAFTQALLNLAAFNFMELCPYLPLSRSFFFLPVSLGGGGGETDWWGGPCLPRAPGGLSLLRPPVAKAGSHDHC